MGWHDASSAVPWVNMKQEDWMAQVGRTITTEVRRLRVEQGLSAQQLSDRCKQLGMEIPRTVLSNFENGRRTNITVAETLVLGAALGVPPAALIFPAGTLEEVEILPGERMDPMLAIEWLSGEAPLLTFGPRSRARGIATRVYWARKIREARIQIQQKLANAGTLQGLARKATSDRARQAYADVVEEEFELIREGEMFIKVWIEHLANEDREPVEYDTTPYVPYPDYGIPKGRSTIEMVSERPPVDASLLVDESQLDRTEE